MYTLITALDKMGVCSSRRLINWYVPIGLFLLALAVRLPALGQFLTPDEHLWLDRSRHFLAGLLDSAYICWSPYDHIRFEQEGLACTLRTGHPGVMTMWTGSLGIVWRYLADGLPGSLLNYILSIQTNPIDLRFVVPVRLPTVLLTTLSVVAIYWLVRRLFVDWRLGLIAGLLLALDPFHVALSRIIHHDALAATFMTLSLLTALVYWGQQGSQHWLMISGGLAGLACLSKSVALFLFLFMVLVAGWSLIERWINNEVFTWQRVSTTVIEWMFWFSCAAITFIALWPAMWVIPETALKAVLATGIIYAQTGQLIYFLGRVSPDPGLLFYPITWLLRSSPVVWVGLILALLYLFRRVRQNDRTVPPPADNSFRRCAGHWFDTPTTKYVSLLLLYAILFVVFMSLSAKKHDRYLLPIYPILNIVAAVGLVQIVKYFKSTRLVHLLVFGLALFFQGFITLTNHPYYFTYFNPLLGGARTAKNIIPVGWGEGLDLVADYLNQKPNADQLSANVWFDRTFAPYFHGQTNSFSNSFTIDRMMSNDYLIIYVHQLQLQIIDPKLLAYLRQHRIPEYTVRLQGVDYATVYAAPVDYHTTSQLNDGKSGKVILFGFRQERNWSNGISIRLVWQNQGVSTEKELWVALQSTPEGDLLNWQSCVLAPDFSQIEAQQVGALLESVCKIETRDLEPGFYQLRLGWGSSSFEQTREEWWVAIPTVGEPALITTATEKIF